MNYVQYLMVTIDILVNIFALGIRKSYSNSSFVGCNILYVNRSGMMSTNLIFIIIQIYNCNKKDVINQRIWWSSFNDLSNLGLIKFQSQIV